MIVFNAESFLAEHKGADIFEVLQMAYDQGRKDGHSDQLEKVVAELKSLLIQDPDEKPVPAQTEESTFGYPAKKKKPKAGAHPKAELMKEMARSGAPLSEIMKAAGCSEPTARKYMKEALDE